MACGNILGNWEKPILLPDTGGTGEDPVLSISRPSGTFRGIFQGDAQEFDVECTEHGRVSRIAFTRIHNDGTTTTRYRAIVVVSRDVIAVGRFTRTTTAGVTTGDWETEKPGAERMASDLKNKKDSARGPVLHEK